MEMVEELPDGRRRHAVGTIDVAIVEPPPRPSHIERALTDLEPKGPPCEVCGAVGSHRPDGRRLCLLYEVDGR